MSDAHVFSADYELEMNPEFPADGVWRQETYGFQAHGARLEVHRGPEVFRSTWGARLVVRVTTPRTTWVGFFSPGVGGPTAVTATPSPQRFIAVNAGQAYLVPADEPGDAGSVGLVPVTSLFAAEAAGLLVMSDFTGLIAIDADGVAWESERLSWDDLRIVAVEGERVRCTGYFGADDGTSAEVVVDARTGRQVEGPQLPPQVR